VVSLEHGWTVGYWTLWKTRQSQGEVCCLEAVGHDCIPELMFSWSLEVLLSLHVYGYSV
jgi:hypothetical protein